MAYVPRLCNNASIKMTVITIGKLKKVINFLQWKKIIA